MNWLFRKKKTDLRSYLDEEKLAQSIALAETNTTGEIKIYIEARNPMVSTLERAAEIFEILEMEQTQNRNAVLIYFAYEDKEYAIFGDKGIFEKHSQEEWDELSHEVHTHIVNNGLQDALEFSVASIGQWLSQEFPPSPECTKNELPDEIVFGS